MLRRTASTLVLMVILMTPVAALADLRIHVEGGGVAPLDRALFAAGAGYNVGGTIDYEVVDLLAVGVFYSFSDFSSTHAADIYDHAVGARLDLRYIRHHQASWFGTDPRRAYGEAFIEVDLAYHHIGNDSHVGWGLGMGYRALVAGPFGLGPYVRFHHIVADVPEHLFCITFGLSFFLSFNLTGDRHQAEEDSGQGNARDDEWSEFEPVSEGEGASEDDGESEDEGDSEDDSSGEGEEIP